MTSSVPESTSAPWIVGRRLPAGRLAAALVKRLPAVSLDWDARQRSRFEAVTDDGTRLAVFLPRGQVLRGGDVLVAENGRMVRVASAAESLLRITACPTHGSPFDLLRAAYHLGNRHVPIELTAEHLQIEPDHVLAEMLRAMHLIVTPVQAPFEPEGGAYGDAGGGHGHAHGHGHGHGHGHEHGHGCNHDHDPPGSARASGHAP
jgi:urease accessory protein